MLRVSMALFCVSSPITNGSPPRTMPEVSALRRLIVALILACDPLCAAVRGRETILPWPFLDLRIDRGLDLATDQPPANDRTAVADVVGELAMPALVGQETGQDVLAGLRRCRATRVRNPAKAG
ncbi:hypothetical protein [Novosphingobium sp.]|uniref:hypothetical protein n=1 Tax=Novosphingobium sp. TaxID=1874826 RepID=UPI0025F3F74C|nr:hypothetical protein [Novosphingobium sp.]